jgi:hypothetical protein
MKTSTIRIYRVDKKRLKTIRKYPKQSDADLLAEIITSYMLNNRPTKNVDLGAFE